MTTFGKAKLAALKADGPGLAAIWLKSAVHDVAHQPASLAAVLKEAQQLADSGESLDTTAGGKEVGGSVAMYLQVASLPHARARAWVRVHGVYLSVASPPPHARTRECVCACVHVCVHAHARACAPVAAVPSARAGRVSCESRACRSMS